MEEFVILIDEGNNEVVMWDVRIVEKVVKWFLNYNGVLWWIEYLSVELVFVICGIIDRLVWFWKEFV